VEIVFGRLMSRLRKHFSHGLMHWVRFLHWTTFAVVELSWLIGVTCVRMVSRV